MFRKIQPNVRQTEFLTPKPPDGTTKAKLERNLKYKTKCRQEASTEHKHTTQHAEHIVKFHEPGIVPSAAVTGNTGNSITE